MSSSVLGGPYSLVCLTALKGCTVEEIKAVFLQYGKLHGDGVQVSTNKKDNRSLVHYETVGSVLKAYQALNGSLCTELSCRLQLQYAKETRLKLLAMGLLDASAAKIIMPARMPAGPVQSAQPSPALTGPVGGISRSVSLVPKAGAQTATSSILGPVSSAGEGGRVLKRPLKPRPAPPPTSSNCRPPPTHAFLTVAEKALRELGKKTEAERLIPKPTASAPQGRNIMQRCTFESKTDIDTSGPPGRDDVDMSVDISSDTTSWSSSSGSSGSSTSSSDIEDDSNDGPIKPKPLKDEFMKLLSSSAIGPVPVPIKDVGIIAEDPSLELPSERDISGEKPTASPPVNCEASSDLVQKTKKPVLVKKRVIPNPTMSAESSSVAGSSEEGFAAPTDTATSARSDGITVMKQTGNTTPSSSALSSVISSRSNQEVKAIRKKKLPNSSTRRTTGVTSPDSSFISLLDGSRSEDDVAVARAQERLTMMGLSSTIKSDGWVAECKEYLSIHSGVFSVDPAPVHYEIAAPGDHVFFSVLPMGRLPLLVPSLPKLAIKNLFVNIERSNTEDN